MQFKKLFALCLVGFGLLGCVNISFARPLPNGNYTQSCYQCHYNRNNTLSCICKNRQGLAHWSSTQIGRRCNFVKNQNGHLTCVAKQPRHPRKPVRHHKKVVVSAGPIYNQNQANRRCPNVCGPKRKWTGQWWTTQYGRNSVCQCIKYYY